ncbi:transmembrane domain-containing protein [Cryptosporidium canis]|uniref:Transmembrane domain-containing protein n=1 Tax=Cryptosporidium canis TaxID=195482 RepID=A0ABQ8P1L3_9CRYT|nr:transmembrane domain-containing protein [Cryptosporidium canis]
MFSRYGQSPDQSGGGPREGGAGEAWADNSEGEQERESFEDCEEDSESEELDSEDEAFDEDEGSRELLMLLKSRARSGRVHRREMISLPSSEFLVIREFPISFGIPVIMLQKLNVRPILFLWLFLLLSVIYLVSVFFDEYIINDVIPLYPLDSVFEPKSEQLGGFVPSFLRSKNSTAPSGGGAAFAGRSGPARWVFPLFGIGRDSESSRTAIYRPLNVTLDVKHCHVQFLNSSTDLSYIKVRSWRLFSKSHMYSGSLGRYRIPSKRKDEFEYVCSHGAFLWILKRYILPWERYGGVNIKGISWRDYKEYCDSSSRPWSFLNDSNLSIKLHQSNTGDYFQCSISFFLASRFQFDELSLKFVPSSSYMRVSSSVPIRSRSSFHLEALHGTFDLRDIYSPNISVTLSDGWASLSLPGLEGSEERSVFIESRGAPIYINSRAPVVVAMPVRIAELAVLRAEHVKVHLENRPSVFDGHGYYRSASVVATLSPDSLFLEGRLSGSLAGTKVTIQGSIPPVYVSVHSKYQPGQDLSGFSDELITWSGRHQWKDPHLLAFSKARFGGFSKWLQEDLASPWVLYVNILGNGDYPRGTWKAVSSRAFIRDPYALVLLSGGLLMPRIYTLYVHVLGLKCMAPTGHSDLEDLDVINVDYNPGVAGGGGESGSGSGSGSVGLQGRRNESDPGVSDEGQGAPERVGILANVTERISRMIGSEGPSGGGDKDRSRGRLSELRRLLGGRSGARWLFGSLRESVYFDDSVGEDDYAGQDSVVHEDVASIRSIGDVGNYIGKSSRMKACESSVTESIFSVINKAIAETAQQPSVIVWTQSEDEESRIYSSDLGLARRVGLGVLERSIFSASRWVGRKLRSAFRLLTSGLALFESVIFPGWLIPGWSRLSKKILKSSMLAEDDLASNPEALADQLGQTLEQYIFTAENDAILKDLVTANDLQGYIVSLSLNILCAILVAAAAMWVLYHYVFPWFLTGIREMQLVSTASHRLNHDFRTSEAAEWIVMVSTIQWPHFGLLLRWNQRQKRRDNEKLCIYIKQVESLSHGGGGGADGSGASGPGLSEFFLYVPANEASLTTHLGRNQQELFVPMKYSDKCIFEVTMPYELISDQKYRLRILRISSSGHIIEQSNWSNEIIPGNKMKFVDFPLLFLRRFLPKKRSSLNLFIDKNTDHYSPFGIPFYFRDIEIIIFDALGGKKKKRGSMSQEDIFDCGLEGPDGGDQPGPPEETADLPPGRDAERRLERSFTGQSLGRIPTACRDLHAPQAGACGSSGVTLGGLPRGLDSEMGVREEQPEARGNRKYVLVARLVRDLPGAGGGGDALAGATGGSERVSENYTSGGAMAEGRSAGRLGGLHASGAGEEEDGFAYLRSYTFKNKSFDLDRVRIEGCLESVDLFGSISGGARGSAGSAGGSEVGAGDNVYILRNRVRRGSGREGSRLSIGGIGGFGRSEGCGAAGSVGSSLYLEQSLISQKRILFELQEADSGQVVANGGVKCSRLVEIAWRSLVNDGNLEDSFEADIAGMHERDCDDVVHGRRAHTKMGYSSEAQENDIIQVHDTISNNTISINKFVDVSIKLYYVEGGQWGELSMLLDRSFWVQYLRHDLSEDIIIDSGQVHNVESLDIEMVTKSSGEGSGSGCQELRHSPNSIINSQRPSVAGSSARTAAGPSATKPRFVNDTPGRIIVNGSDTQLSWVWRELKKDSSSYIPKKLHLHLFDHYTDTHLSSLHGDRSIPNTGNFAWSVDVPFISQRSSSRDVYLVMAVSKDDIPSNVTIQGKVFVPRGAGSRESSGCLLSGLGGEAPRRSSMSSKQIIVAVSNSFKDLWAGDGGGHLQRPKQVWLPGFPEQSEGLREREEANSHGGASERHLLSRPVYDQRQGNGRHNREQVRPEGRGQGDGELHLPKVPEEVHRRHRELHLELLHLLVVVISGQVFAQERDHSGHQHLPASDHQGDQLLEDRLGHALSERTLPLEARGLGAGALRETQTAPLLWEQGRSPQPGQRGGEDHQHFLRTAGALQLLDRLQEEVDLAVQQVQELEGHLELYLQHKGGQGEQAPGAREEQHLQVQTALVQGLDLLEGCPASALLRQSGAATASTPSWRQSQAGTGTETETERVSSWAALSPPRRPARDWGGSQATISAMEGYWFQYISPRSSRDRSSCTRFGTPFSFRFCPWS